jgi:valyl-tRNA synthetase
MIVAEQRPDKCTCGNTAFVQDEDVLDTWFSSGLWPFSTLGWPDMTEDLKFFYPTNVLVTGYDIIFFWVARMIMSGFECMGEKPFEYVSIHGLVRDPQGRKMSKSLGNGIDPLELIDEYGADALRFSLAVGVRVGGDLRFSSEKVLNARNFANKIWNAARFVLMNTGDTVSAIDESQLDIADKWILARLSETIGEVTALMERFELGMAAQKVHDFLWNEYCDWYIEMAKPRLMGEDGKDTAVAVLNAVLADTMKLLHPFMPFITEEIHASLPGTQGSIMVSDWPTSQYAYEAEQVAMGNVMELIRGIRNVRAEMNVPANKKPVIKILAGSDMRADYEMCAAYIARLSYASDIVFIDDKTSVADNAVSVVGVGAEAFMALGELIDIDKEIARLAAEADKLSDEIRRAEGKLSNKSFVDKAPEKVVQAERDKLIQYQDKRAAILQRKAELLQ